MSGDHRDRSRHVLTAALRPTVDCIAPDRFDEPLSADEQQHVSRCGRCQTEIALWHEFRDATPTAGEGAAVEWIAAELRRRRGLEPAARRRPWLLSRWQSIGVGMAAALALTIGYTALNREPDVRPTLENQAIYRSSLIRVVKPIGELATAPETMEWLPVEGAVEYDARVLEVDRTLLWRASSTIPRIEIPPRIVARFVSGKTVLWHVSALDREGRTLATSGEQRFRVGQRSKRQQREM